MTKVTQSWSEPTATGWLGWEGGHRDRAGTREGGEEGEDEPWNGGMWAGGEVLASSTSTSAVPRVE